MYPEGFQFDTEGDVPQSFETSDPSQKKPLSIAGSQAIYYFGEDAGKNSEQSGIIGFVIGYFWNIATIYMTLPFAPKALAAIVN